MITGLIVGAFGFGAFIFGLITKAIVNPDEEKVYPEGHPLAGFFPEDVAMRVPHMFNVCLIIWGALCLLCIILIKRNPFTKQQ